MSTPEALQGEGVREAAGRMDCASRWGWARLETPWLTACFWGTALLYALAFAVVKMPPLIDYPQHLAVGAILRRLMDPGSPERALYEFNPLTYNGGFHMLVAVLSLVIKPEAAGKLLLACLPILTAAAALAVMRVAERPLWYAFFLLPLSASYLVGWGFINFALAAPCAMLVVVWWIRWERGDSGLAIRIATASLAIAYTHVLALLCVCTTIAALALARWPSIGSTFRDRVRTVLRMPLPVLPAVAFCMFVFVWQRHSPHAYWEGNEDGQDIPAWYKLYAFPLFAVGNFADRSDERLLLFGLALLALLWLSQDRRGGAGGGTADMRALFLCWLGIYLVIPRVFISTWFVFERFPAWVLTFGVAATPAARSWWVPFIRAGAIAVAILSALNTVTHLTRIPDMADADAIVDDIPEGSRVIAVTYSTQGLPVVHRDIWVHLVAYFQARRSGQIAYTFAKFESMPVHYRPGVKPPEVTPGFEWSARGYDPLSPVGRHFTTVLVRTPDGAPDEDPRELTFGPYAEQARVMSHRGRFWLFDVTPITAFQQARSSDGSHVDSSPR